MEINGSDTFTYMIYDKELLYIFDYFNTEHKNGSNQKRVNSRFFHEKSETLKKYFFIKVPKMAKLVNSYFPFPRRKQKVGALKRTFHPKLYT